MKKKNKAIKILCLLFIVLLMMSCGCFSAAAADELRWVNPYSQLTVVDEFHDDSGEMNTMNYGNINGYERADLERRWATSPTVQGAQSYEATQNQQLIFYQKTYMVGINYWNTYGQQIMNSINAIKDKYPDKFEEYSKAWKDNFQALKVAMRRGDKLLFLQVTYSNIADNNRAIADCTDEFNTAITNLKALQQNLVVTDNEARFEVNTNSGFDSLNNLPDAMWRMIGLTITWGGNSNGSLYGMSLGMIATVANTVKPYVVCLAYLVWITAFALEIKDSALRFDIAEPRGIISILVNLLIGKVCIDLAINVCLALLRIINMISENILTLLYPESSSTAIDLSILHTDFNGNVDWWQLSSTLFSRFPSLVICICTIVCLIKLMVKIISRNFQLGCLLCVAPIAFAAAGGDRTRKYFEKFLLIFLSVAAQIVVIAIVYVMATSWIINAQIGGQGYSSYMAWVVMFIIAAATKVIVKPPKQFEALFG